MRNIHKSTPPSFRRRGNAAAIVKAPPPGALTKGPDRKFPGLHPPPGGATSPFLSTNRRFAFPILALLAALAVGLLFLLPGGPLQAQSSDGTIMYPENGMEPVATYTAVDPEMTAVKWSLSGDDAGDFDIDGGVLTFKKSPDYEAATGGGSTENDVSTTYSVTVLATDATRREGMKEVTVIVTNVDEPGTVKLTTLQLTASVSDPDDNETGHVWQWARSRSGTSGWGMIDKAIAATYIPADADAGYYLRATVTYKDTESVRDTKTAQGVSANAVRAARSQNDAPKFPDQDLKWTGTRATPQQERWRRTLLQVRLLGTRSWPRMATATY